MYKLTIADLPHLKPLQVCIMTGSGGDVDQQVPRRYLRSVPFLASLNSNDLNWVQQRFERRRYEAGETILRSVREGFLGLLEQGEIVVISQTAGTQSHSATLHPGDHFSTLTDDRRAANTTTVRAVTPTVLWFLYQDDCAILEQQRGSSAGVYKTRPLGSQIFLRIKSWEPHIRRFGLVVAVILFIWTIFVSALGQSFRADLRFAIGSRYLQRGQLDAAMRQFQAAIRIDPLHAASYGALGDIYFQRGRWVEALAAYERASILDPDSDVIQNNLGVVRGHQGDGIGAVESLRQAADLGGNAFQVHVNLGNQYLANGDWLNAGRAFREGLRLDPNLPMTRYNLAVTYYHLGRYTDAREEFERALQLDPDLAPAYAGVGILAFEEGQFSAAQVAFQRATELNPHDATVYFYLGLVGRSMEQPQQAIAAFRSAFDLTADPTVKQQAEWHLKELGEQP
jgi:tetratricopeptide (TPR) repeat protein